MNELIRIDYRNDQPTVSARELHAFLEAEARFNDWFPQMCEYGFTEGQDFRLLKMERVQQEGGHVVSCLVDDALLSIDMAKEIGMLQCSERGRRAHQYFLQLEKDWNSPENVMARALRMADRSIKALEAKAKADRPKVMFADAVSVANTSILVGELAKLLKQNGVDIGQNRLFSWMRDNGYLIRRQGTNYNMPTQKSMEMGLFEIKQTVVIHSDGHTSVNKTPKVTGKGQQYFIQVFLSDSPCSAAAQQEGNESKRTDLPVGGQDAHCPALRVDP